MSKFNLSKNVSLASVLGEGHEQDYLSFKPVAFKDAKELEQITSVIDPDNIDNKEALEQADKAVAFIRDRFVSGKITDEESKELVDVEAVDFDNGNLPMEVINYAMRQLMGERPEGFTKA